MSSNEEPYQPKYTTIEAVPLGSFDYPEADVRDSLRRAEGRLEDDVNDGATISEERRDSTHADAVENLATYRLLRPATGPNEAGYGEVAEYGDNQIEYLQTYKQEYRECVESLRNVGAEEGDEAGDDAYAVPFQFQSS